MKTRAAFTLIELVLVMALLVTLAAIAVPRLSRSMRGHNLDQEADCLLALTEYARDEAASQGVPMVVWIDADGGRCGVDAKPGFGPAGGGDNARAHEYVLGDDVHLDPVGPGMVPAAPTASPTPNANAPVSTSTHGGVILAEFAPDGTLVPGSVASVRLADRANDALILTQTADACGYEITRDQSP